MGQIDIFENYYLTEMFQFMLSSRADSTKFSESLSLTLSLSLSLALSLSIAVHP